MEQQKDEFVSLKELTHKGLANVVTHMNGRGMSADFSNSVGLRDWARYYAAARACRTSPVVFRASLKIKNDKKDLTES